VPAHGDDVFLKSSANCVINTNTNSLNSFNMTGYTGTLSGSSALKVRALSGTQVCLFAGTITWTGQLQLTADANCTINLTSGGKTINDITVQPTSGGTISQQDALTITTTIVLNGSSGGTSTWNTNGYSINATGFTTSGANNKILNITNSVITLTGTGTIWDLTNGTTTFTSTGSTVVVNNTSATAKTFAGGGATYNVVTFSGDNVTITGNNTYATLNVNTAGLTNGLKFTINSIQTVTNFTTNGYASNLAKILSSSAGSHFHLTTGSAQISVDYMSIKDSTVDQANTWYAGANSTDVSGNSGWIFNSSFIPMVIGPF
jgi:hypothetical protein